MSLTASGIPVVPDDEKSMAMLAHLCCFVPLGLVIGPLALYSMKKDTSAFITYHALQAALFQALFGAFVLVAFLAGGAFVTVFAALTFGFGGVCYVLMCAIPVPIFAAIPPALKAKNGEWSGYPLIGGIFLPAGFN